MTKKFSRGSILYRGILFGSILACAVGSLICLSATALYAQDTISFKRFAGNPIIRPELLQGSDGDDINGPSLIKTPDWLPHRLGKYYLYFAHHKGKYIRLAYADKLEGPWKIYKPGTLQLSDCKTCETGLPNAANNVSVRHEGAETSEDGVTHVASPDILVDNANKQLILYFHCPIEKGPYKGQYSLRAVSKDGIHFTADSTVLGYSYFRVFYYKGYYYSISRAGLLARSKDGIAAFEAGPNPFKDVQDKSNYLRHAAVRLTGDTLQVFYSRIGDGPERIVLSRIILNDDWMSWTASSPVTVVSPDADYEGGQLPVTVSKPGLFYGKTRELRDPYVFEDAGKLYLVYAVAGETSLAIGELKLPTREPAPAFRGETLYADVKKYVGFGIHRTGTDGDYETSRWIKGILDKNGFKTEYLEFPVRQFFPDKAELSVGESRLEVFPFWPVKDPQVNITAGLVDGDQTEESGYNGKIVFLRITNYNDISNGTAARLKKVIAAGAKAAILLIQNAAGEIATVNTASNTPWDIPIVQVAPRDSAAIVGNLSGGAQVSLTVSGVVKEVQARNVIGTFGEGPKTVIISTPISGWFTCGGERGPGIAVFNALAAWVGSQHLPYKFIFTANSSHELADHNGVHYFLEKKLPNPAELRLWVHLGASFATYAYEKTANGLVRLPRVDSSRIVFYSGAEVENTVNSVFKDMAIRRIKGQSFGEMVVAVKAGYGPIIGFVGAGSFPYFHTPADNASTTSPAFLEEIAGAVKKAIEKELSH